MCVPGTDGWISRDEAVRGDAGAHSAPDGPSAQRHEITTASDQLSKRFFLILPVRQSFIGFAIAFNTLMSRSRPVQWNMATIKIVRKNALIALESNCCFLTSFECGLVGAGPA